MAPEINVRITEIQKATREDSRPLVGSDQECDRRNLTYSFKLAPEIGSDNSCFAG
jgi:hypothetical protein